MTNWKLFACALLTGACCGTALTARGGSLPSGHVYAASVQQAARTLTGTVTDSHGEPLPGVSVSVKGTTLGTITDIDGKYTLKVHEGAELVFSFVGMQTQTVRFKGSLPSTSSCVMTTWHSMTSWSSATAARTARA